MIEKKNLRKRKLLIGLMSFFAVIFLISSFLLSYRVVYANKTMKNQYYQGNDLSGKTKTQVAALIKNKITTQLDEKIVISSDYGKSFDTTFSETGVSVDYINLVNEIYSVGRNSNFVKSLYELPQTLWQKKTYSYSTSFDSEKYKLFVAKISENLELSSVDASLAIKNGEIVASSPQNGKKIDSSNLQNEISDRLISLDDSDTKINVPTIPVEPSLSSEELSGAKTEAEAFMSHQIQLTLNENVYSVDRKTIGSWIVFSLQNGKYSASLAKSSIKKYVGTISAKVDIATIDNKISAIDNSVLQQGRQGLYVEQDDATNKIYVAVSSTTQVVIIPLLQTTKDPQTIKVFPDEGIIPGRFPGKYIDVDLTGQIMTIFEGTNQMGQYQISSGKASTPTPTGTRTIQDKSPRAWSAPYGLYMPWWMGMGNSYGIHELPEWPNGYKEGESHLGTPVSHGCVRLGVGPAQTVWNWAEIGTPVYIHK